MTVEILLLMAMSLMFAAFCVCLWCVLQLQREMEKRIQRLVILLRAQNLEEAAMAVEALDPIEKRETKERIQNAIKQEPTPEEQEADLVSQLASQYANTPLYPTA